MKKESNGLKRKTIVFLLNNIDGRYQLIIWPIIARRAEDLNYNLIILGGMNPFAPYGFEYKYEALANLRDKGQMDGLILLTGTLWEYDYGSQAKESFLAEFSNVPRVSIALKIPGIPSIMVDNWAGMYQAVSHLIEVHNHKKIAFIRGNDYNEEARIRYQAYCAALRDHQIPLDERIVYPGNFRPESGDAAILCLLDERKVTFDAICCANDDMATGAIRVLKSKGYRIPEDLSITGFDDTDEARFGFPPLTSVRQPISEQAVKAVEMIDALMRGENQDDIYLPTELIPRRSCNCLPKSAYLAGRSLEKHEPVSMDPVREKFVSGIMEAFPAVFRESVTLSLSGYLEGMVDILFSPAVSEVKCDNFLKLLSDFIHCLVNERIDVMQLNLILDCLKAIPMPGHESAERHMLGLFEKSRILVCEGLRLEEAVSHVDFARSNWILRDIVQKIITAFDVAELSSLVASDFPRLQIPSSFLSLYSCESRCTMTGDWDRPELLELTAAYDLNRQSGVPTAGMTYPAGLVFPERIFPEDRRFTFLTMPLFIKEDQFGFITYEIGTYETNWYESLRAQLSCSLKGGYLFRRQKRTEHGLEKTISDLTQSNKKLEDLSLHDEQTGLYNRRWLDVVGEQVYCEIARDKGNFYVIFADIKGIKEINDRHGHEEGNTAIAKTAELLLECFRGEDIVVRLGGDEFVILMLSSGNKPEEVLKRLNGRFSEYNLSSGKPYRIEICFGIVDFSENRTLSFKELLQLADKALYRSKRGSRAEGNG